MRDALAVAIQERLDLLRRGSPTAFEEIQAVTTAWLVESRLPQRTVALYFDLSVEQLIQIARLEPGTSIKGWTRTWARCAAAIAMKHPTVTRTERADLDQRISADPEGAADAALQFISGLAQGVTGKREAFQTEAVERLTAWASPSRLPRAIAEDVLSDERFSEGLREKLLEFYGEIQFLTIKQMDAVEAGFRERRHWLEGPAGSGKTLVAIEAVYRALKAGRDCLFVYRSTQFEHILRRLLDAGPGKLSLLSHLDFSMLLFEIDRREAQPDSVREAVAEYVPVAEWHSGDPLVEMLIVDDYGLSDDLSHHIPTFTDIADRVMLLVGTDQNVSHLHAEDSRAGEEGHAPTEAPLAEISKDVSCPPDYVRSSLAENLRNSRKVMDRGNELLETRTPTAVRTVGSHAIRASSWQELDHDLIEEATSLLSYFPPSGIKVLVDPYLEPIAEKGLSADEFLEERPKLLSRLPPIARAVLCSASESFKSGILHEEAENGLRQHLKNPSRSEMRFIYVDGSETHVVHSADIQRRAQSATFEENFQAWRVGSVMAPGILDPQALVDPFSGTDAILIYPSCLFIGLESDAIIYVRNGEDPYEPSPDMEPGAANRIRAIRNRHHFMAVSRARFHLLEITVD